MNIPTLMTQCTHCHTVFKVERKQLHVANGKVRCGICLSIFYAKKYHDLSDTNLYQNPPTDSSTPSYQHKDSLESPAICLKHIAVNNARAEQLLQKPKPQSKHRCLWFFSSTLPLLLVALYLVWINSDQLAQKESIRPWYKVICRSLGCKLPQIKTPMVSIKGIQAHKIHIRNTDQSARTLTLDAIIENHEEPRHFPVIKVSFSNSLGQIIDQRTFKPEQYLPAETTDLMPTDTPIYISLSSSAIKAFTGYQLQFFTQSHIRD